MQLEIEVQQTLTRNEAKMLSPRGLTTAKIHRGIQRPSSTVEARLPPLYPHPGVSFTRNSLNVNASVTGKLPSSETAQLGFIVASSYPFQGGLGIWGRTAEAFADVSRSKGSSR